jgi:hypothetical protein
MTTNQIQTLLDAHDPSQIQGVICTDYARWAQNVLGQGRIVGFFDELNPGTKTGQHAGGHDFLLINNRFIVDLWIRDVTNWTNQIVFDLCSPHDKPLIKTLYGDQACWETIA